MKTIDVSINGSVVTAQVVHQDGSRTDDLPESEEDSGLPGGQTGDIVTELPPDKDDNDGGNASSDDMQNESYKEMDEVNDIVTMATPGGRRQVFAEIIEEEIIEEIDETVVVSLKFQCCLSIKYEFKYYIIHVYTFILGLRATGTV